MEIALPTARPIAEKTRGSVPAQLMIKDATPQTLVSQCSQLATIPAFNAKTTVNPNVDLIKLFDGYSVVPTLIRAILFVQLWQRCHIHNSVGTASKKATPHTYVSIS